MSLSKLILNLAEKVRPVLVKIIPAKVLSSMKANVINNGAKNFADVKLEPFCRDAFPDGVNLIGDIRADTGLGQSMRYVSQILDASGADNLVYNYYVPPGVSMTDTSCDDKIADALKYNVNIFHINANELPVGFMDLGKEMWDRHYNIGHWVWELEEFPEEWIPSFNLIDEIWTPTEFVRKTLMKYTDKPVYALPFPVQAETDEKMDRAYFGLPKDKFLFMMMFDLGSGMARKNPLAIVESFKKAFDQDNEHVGLVVKLTKSDKNAKDIEYIRGLLEGYDNIEFICENLSRVQVNSLISCVDVYVSLHRAEGFGLVMAEAMMVGTPVIATNWSGNTEFMNEDSACLVDYSLVELEKNAPPFKKGYHWADADTDQAAGFMKRLFEDKEYYDIMKNNAYNYVRERLNMERSAKIVMDRLQEIYKCQ